MPLNYSTACKNALGGSISYQLGSSATVELCSAGYSSVLVVFNLNQFAGDSANGVLTFAGFPKVSAAQNSGTVALARVKDSNGIILFDGLTVGLSGSDINFNSTTITAGANITLNSLAITIQ